MEFGLRRWMRHLTLAPAAAVPYPRSLVRPGLPWKVQQHPAARLPLDRGADGGAAQSDDQVAFSMPGGGKSLRVSMALADHDLRRLDGFEVSRHRSKDLSPVGPQNPCRASFAISFATGTSPILA